MDESLSHMPTRLKRARMFVAPSHRTVRLLFVEDEPQIITFTLITLTRITELVGVVIEPGIVSKVCPVVLEELL